MSALRNTVAYAADIAYEEETLQIVGRIDGDWMIAFAEDTERQSWMEEPKFMVDRGGLDPVDVMNTLLQAGIEGDQDWQAGTTTYQIDDELIIVSAHDVEVKDA